tara:strand:- start:7363 stop:7887 length:525 start_codon:yes stop_codon:yes gene_type:complete
LIKLVCDNPLIFKTISNYLLHKNFLLSSNNEKHRITLKIHENKKFIMMDIDGDQIELSLPVDINSLASQALKKLIDLNFSIESYKFYPFQRIISNESKKSFLSDIQNKIMTSLLTSIDGIDKDVLYQSIWKKDKLIFINKLDTHLTNLKKKLKHDLDIKVNFQSHKKNLRLLID